MGVVDEVKERLDIVEVISPYVTLSKAGRYLRAVCPFHSEKTPSFYVFPENQRWRCFGACGEGGDIFSFVMKREGWDFKTALEELARRAGVELRPRTPAQVRHEEETQRLLAALADAATYYHNLFLSSPEAQFAREYVARRGLSAETIEQFQLGYSLSGWDSLRNYLIERGFSVQELVSAGLVVEREDGTGFDRFRERLMIPIRDARGRTVGFGARTLDPQGHPKYMNSPQTALFDKSHLLYGLDVARRAIRQKDQVVIVEGYMDVMRAHQEGFRNVVAQMGTALTEAQLRQLYRTTRRFVLALDPDEAGIQATMRGLETARETFDRERAAVFDPRGLVGFEGRLGAEIRVLSLPAGKDPDELIGSDPEFWVRLVDEADPVVEFVFRLLMNGTNPQDAKDRARVVDQILPLLRDVPDRVEREIYVQGIARELHIPERTLLEQLYLSEQHRAQRRSSDAADREIRQRTPADLEGYLLSMLLRRPQLFGLIDEAFDQVDLHPLQPQDFEDPVNRTLFEMWRRMASQSSSLEELRQVALEPVAEQLDILLADDEELTEEQWIRESVQAGLRLRKRLLKRRGEELRMLLEESEWLDLGDSINENARALLRIAQADSRNWSRFEPGLA